MKLPHVSASQITTYRACKRLWSIEKLAGLTREKSASMDIGTQVHALIEHYLKTGQAPPADHEHRTKFDAVASYLPAARPHGNPHLLVEHQFDFPVYPGGTHIIGGIDIALPPWRVDLGAGDGWAAGVDDHKTTSDLRYAKTPEELAKNTQLIIYAYYLFRLPSLVGWDLLPSTWWSIWTDGLDRVRLRHNYIQTRNVVRQGKAKQVEVWLDWPAVAKEWAGIVSDVKEMEALAERVGPDLTAIVNEGARVDYLRAEVDGDATGAHCHAYGRGCAFKGQCPEANTLVALAGPPQIDPVFANLFNGTTTKETTMANEPQDDLAARLQKRMASKAPATPAPTPAAEVAPTPAPAPAAPAAPDPAAGPAIAPPDAPPRETTAADLAPAPAPVPTTTEEAPKARRGRKTKGERIVEAGQATVAPAAVEVKVEQTITTDADPDKVAAAVAKAMKETTETPATCTEPTEPCARLYINCRPLRGADAAGEPFAFEKWLDGVLAAIRDELKVPHYKLLKFGAGNGALATAMAARFDQLPAVVVVDTLRPEAQEFLDLAIPRAKVIVQGVR